MIGTMGVAQGKTGARGAGSLPAHVDAWLAAQSRELKRCAPRIRDGDADAVHDLRVACRRMRAALKLLGGSISAKRAERLGRRLRKAARRLADLRDVDVMLQTLDAASVDPAPLLANTPEPLERAREVLRARRRRAATAARRTMRRGLIRRMRRGVRRLRRGILRRTPACFAPRAAQTALESTIAVTIARLLAHVGNEFDAALHDARLGIKRLRYEIELLAPHFRDGHGDLVARLRRLQETLGAMHDAASLEQWLTALSAAPRGGVAGLAQLIERVRSRRCALADELRASVAGLSVESFTRELRAALAAPAGDAA